MEFETNTPSPDSEIDSEQRTAAMTRQLTVSPIHEDVVPDDLADAEISGGHAAEPALANLPTDMEATVASPSGVSAIEAPRHAYRRMALVVGIMAAIMTSIGVGAVVLAGTS